MVCVCVPESGGMETSKHVQLCGCCWLSRALAEDRPPKRRSSLVRHPWCMCVCMRITTVSIKVGRGLLFLSHLIYSLSFLPSQMKRVLSVFQVP